MLRLSHEGVHTCAGHFALLNMVAERAKSTKSRSVVSRMAQFVVLYRCGTKSTEKTQLAEFQLWNTLALFHISI